ncbi:MAG: DUF2971 domain-containing protein [Barnesiella sp.]|nr:DUF2971 domain-containing protein [Barnesiella sp.]
MKKIHTTHGIYPGTKLKQDERYKRLYHFTSFDTFMKIWLSGKLLFGNVQKVNDLQEAAFPVSTGNMQHWAVMQKFRELRLKYKQISLCMDYDSYIWGCMSTQMWAYYADKSQGVCIELDFSKLNFPENCIHGPVKYRNVTNEVTLDPKISTAKDISKFILKNKSKLFFTKQFTWKGENEYRIVSNSDEALDISSAISCIYVTDTDTVEFELLTKLVGDKTPIKCLKFIARSGLSIPVIPDARNDRESRDKMKNDDFQKSMQEQINGIIESCKDDETKSLLMPYIIIPKK